MKVSDLASVVDSYESTGEKLDDRVSDLEGRIIKVDENIVEEVEKLSEQTWDDKLNIRATIGVFADVEGDVEIALIYGMCPSLFISLSVGVLIIL